MAETVRGVAAAQRRIAAISNPASHKGLMKLAANVVRGKMVTNMRLVGRRKTGNTGRSLHVENVTETSAQIVGSQVALWIDEGTGLFGPRHQRITPKAAQALRWMGGPAGSLRLTGSQRKGKAGAGAGYVFARSTKGMEARPYIQRSIQEGAKAVGVELKGEIISIWNGAA